MALSAVTACAGGGAQHDASYTLMPITNVGMVVGEWEGVVKKNHSTLPQGSVRLMIRANGSYLFAGQSASNVAVGSGELEQRDSRLVGNAEKRAVTFTLYDHKGQAVLFVESINRETGERYSGELTRVH
jgi:hypothetical protein